MNLFLLCLLQAPLSFFPWLSLSHQRHIEEEQKDSSLERKGVSCFKRGGIWCCGGTLGQRAQEPSAGDQTQGSHISMAYAPSLWAISLRTVDFLNGYWLGTFRSGDSALVTWERNQCIQCQGLGLLFLALLPAFSSQGLAYHYGLLPSGALWVAPLWGFGGCLVVGRVCLCYTHWCSGLTYSWLHTLELFPVCNGY